MTNRKPNVTRAKTTTPKKKNPKGNASAMSQPLWAKRYAHQLQIIQDISRLTGSGEPTEFILTQALQQLRYPLGYQAAQIYRLSPHSKDIWLYIEEGQGSKPVTEFKDIFSIDEKNIVSDAARLSKVIYMPDMRKGPYAYSGRHEKDHPISSEIAIPLQVGRTPPDTEILGVLRVQSTALDDFDDTTISFLNSLACLLSATIKSNQTIDQLANDLQEIKILYNLQRKEDITNHLAIDHHQEAVGYEYTKNDFRVSTELSPGARLALNQEQIEARVIQSEDGCELVVPIQLYGETIGILGVESDPDNEGWTGDDWRLLEEVSSQVAVAIENSRLLQQTRKRTQELSFLFETGQQLAEASNLPHVYEILTRQVANYIQADVCTVSLLNPARSHFEVIVEKSRDETGHIIDVTQSWSDALEEVPSLRHVFERPVISIIHLDEPGVELNRHHYQKNGHSLKTLLIYPLIVKQALVGVLQVGHGRQRRDYTQNELQLVQAIVSQVAVAVENVQQFQKTEEALAETRKLYQISRALVEASTLEQIFNVVLENIKTYQIDRASISLIDPHYSGNQEGLTFESVTIVASWDSESDQILPVGTQISASVFPLVKASAKPPFDPLISEDLSRAEGQDPRMDEGFRLFMYEGLGAVTMFSTPMFLGTEYKGVLSISTRKPHTYTEQEIRIYQTLADQAIVAIENHRLFETLRRERDQAALLHEIDQALSQAKTVEQVQESVLRFTERIGAVYSEICITDSHHFYSTASTVPDRQNLTAPEVDRLAGQILAQKPVIEALNEQRVVIYKDEAATLALESRTYLAEVKSIVFVPFFARLSGLQGVLIFYYRQENGFEERRIMMLEAIADQTAAMLENLKLLEQTTVALSETELLYNATREFSGAQHPEELLASLAKTLMPLGEQAEITIDSMVMATIPQLSAGNTPERFEVLAKWHRSAIETQTSSDYAIHEVKLNSTNYQFVSQLTANDPVIIYYEQLNEKTRKKIDISFGRVRTILAVPLKTGTTWLGTLFLNSIEPQVTFAPNIMQRISTLAGQIAVVIRNLQLVAETQQNLYNSEILSHLGQALLVADSVEAIYGYGLEAIAATEPSRGAAIFRYVESEVGTQVELAALWSTPGRLWPSIELGSRFTIETLGLTALLKTGNTLVSENVPEDNRFSEQVRELLTTMQVYSFVAVPIWLDKNISGFILVGNCTSVAFPVVSVRLYEDVARQISGTLENLHLFEEAQHRASLLQTAAEVSQAASSYLDLDTLLFESVDLIRDRFDYYHVSIFLVDEYQKFAVVKASTGEIGQKMLEMQHKLEVGGRSIVGTATATAKSRIARDVGRDGIHFKNPLLPETSSEMALPLIARGRVIGALDVQSKYRNAFTDIDITILQSMANQLANAIAAALSFQDAQQALERVQKLNEYYLREQWAKFLKEHRTAGGYRLTKSGFVETVMDSRSPQIDKVLKDKEPIIMPKVAPYDEQPVDQALERVAKKRSTSQLYISIPETPKTNESSIIAAPLSLPHDVVIGALDFEIPSRGMDWEEDSLKIIEAVTSQVAQAIEAARLFEQTQVAREEAEALYRVGRALVTAESEAAMFQTVLTEMLATLGLQDGNVVIPEREQSLGRIAAVLKKGKLAGTGHTLSLKNNPVYSRVLTTKKPVSIENITTHPLTSSFKEHEVESLLVVPVIINNEVIGIITVEATGQRHHFTEREINLANAMADQLAIMLQNRRLLQETQRRAVQLQTSADVGRAATSILNQDELLERAVKLIRDRFGFYHVQIFLIDEDEKFAVLYKSTGSTSDKLLSFGYKVAIGSQSVIGQAMTQRKACVIHSANPVDFDTPHYYSKFLPESQAELAIPLQVGEKLIGVLDVHSANPTTFTKDEISILETLGAQIGIAIQNARAFKEQQETAERLKEIDKLKTQFLANMSHELRTPLNSIIGFSRVILKGIDGPLTDLQKTDLTSIHNSGQHLLSLINNILDLSKIEAGKMELNFEEIEIEPIIKSVMATALALVKDKPVELIQEAPKELPAVWADPTRVRQVILNLVSNACKFTDEGSVTLKASADEQNLTISVIDTGIGIPENQLEDVFEEFTQVDASTTRKVGGTGLGLPISRHFIEMHQGRIWVESELGQGSTFTFTIPIKPSEETLPSLDALIGPANDETQEKVVVAIDDDPGVIKLYERFLQTQGYKVIGISNSKQIMPQIEAHAPSAILLDVLMPEKDGWSIIRELKENPKTEHIPVVICSIVSDKKRGFSLGAADYMIKPITESDLLRALERLENQTKEQIKVLVIDDQADDILLIRRLLEAQFNYSIIEAKSGKEGLKLVEQVKPDLIILDLTMPEMDGFSVVEALKNNDSTRGIPIIIVSAKDLTPQEDQFLTGQVEALLRKGIYTEEELLEDVKQALAQLHLKETVKI